MRCKKDPPTTLMGAGARSGRMGRVRLRPFRIHFTLAANGVVRGATLISVLSQQESTDGSDDITD